VHGVSELSDVARPRRAAARDTGVLREGNRVADVGGVGLGKVIEQHIDVHVSVPERGHLDREHAEPTEEVCTEGAAGYHRAQVPVGCTNDPGIDGGLRLGTDRADAAGLEDPQQEGLAGKRKRKLADLVEEHHATVGPGERASMQFRGQRWSTNDEDRPSPLPLSIPGASTRTGS